VGTIGDAPVGLSAFAIGKAPCNALGMRSPWQFKVGVQFVLAHVPGGETVNNALQRWNGSFCDAAIRGRVLGLSRCLSEHFDATGKTIVEIGTGWDAINALMLHVFGARRVYSYDHVRHLRFDLAMNVLRQIGASTAAIAEISGIEPSVLEDRIGPLARAANSQELLDAAAIEYMAPGDAARTGLPDHSVDIVYSYAVLEHVSEDVIASITKEARRVLVPGGIAFHNIGEHDHYVSVDPSISKVNFLRYPEWAWSLFVKNKISYHNRLREPDFLRIFGANGARVRDKESYIDPKDLETVKRMRLDSRFAGLTPEELAVTKTQVTLSFD
jgi:SAM-dependent methyltransferase